METQRAFSLRGPARWLAPLDCLRIAAIVGEPANDNFDGDPPPASSARVPKWANFENDDRWVRRAVTV
jgi:hypothetical protein